MLPISETDHAPPDHDFASHNRREEKDDFDNDEFVEESTRADSLSQEHRDYLLKRHGTLDLDPIPDMKDADPYNWSVRKVL